MLLQSCVISKRCARIRNVVCFITHFETVHGHRFYEQVWRILATSNDSYQPPWPPPPSPPIPTLPSKAAVGAEFPKDLTSLEGTDAYGDIEGRRLAGFSFPVEVRDYAGFDMDAFKEMK